MSLSYLLPLPLEICYVIEKIIKQDKLFKIRELIKKDVFILHHLRITSFLEIMSPAIFGHDVQISRFTIVSI